MVLQAEIFENNSTTYTKSLYQHDKNVTLVFDGIDLPRRYEVHFANDKEGRSISVARVGDQNGVKIPDELLSTGYYVYAWVCDTGESTGSGTVYSIVIPVIPRPIPVPVEYAEAEPCDKDHFAYEVDPDEENLTFITSATMNGAITPNIEEET